MTDVGARLSEVERRAVQNDKNARFVLVKLDKHEKILDRHGQVLDRHGQILDQHTLTLERHTELHNQHTEQLRLIRTELDGHTELHNQHTEQLQFIREELAGQLEDVAWLRRAQARTMDFFGIESPEEE